MKKTTDSIVSIGELNPAWLTFFREAKRLAELARQRRDEREATEQQKTSIAVVQLEVQEQVADLPLDPTACSMTRQVTTAHRAKARRKIAV